MTADLLPPGVVLAGGRSSRMGTNKTLLPIAGDTILGHIVRRLSPQVSHLSLNAPADFPNPYGLPFIPDTMAGQAGPLAGVLAALKSIEGSSASHVLTVPCDSPFLPLDLAARLLAGCEGKESIVIAAAAGRSHPVFGLWPISVAAGLERWLADPDNRRITAFLKRHRVVTIDFPSIETAAGPLDPFLNLNTPEEFAEAERFAGVLA